MKNRAMKNRVIKTTATRIKNKIENIRLLNLKPITILADLEWAVHVILELLEESELNESNVQWADNIILESQKENEKLRKENKDRIIDIDYRRGGP